MRSYALARCLVCSSADATTLAEPDAVKAEVEALWEFHGRRLSPRTPPERLVDRVAFSQDPPWRVVRCDGCGLVYRNPAESPAHLRQAYADDEVGRGVLRQLHDAQLGAARSQLQRLQEHGARGGEGLEVGSYVGAFLSAARGTAWRFAGLDVNAQVNEFARALGHTVHDGDLEGFDPGRAFDAVAIWNTFDQLPDPRSALYAAHRRLRPGGVLSLRVPNGACYARWRARHAQGGLRGAFATRLLAYNNLLSFPYRFGFTPASLGRLVEEAGYSVRAVVGDVLVPVADRWTRRWAVAEAAVLKRLTRRWTPWFELYATRR